ncbi:uncharacterized protein LOC110453938 isoform X2 [Mizuhopecten yessoensis]|nr:uncharacterized protein LOC110453938 isoform X2 [Mizuhopecten yessoensis]XP_021358860.1 uncharacterized protein LOC110453938 isoform X2 [Mizuhopecten yessoensis]XP_021358861.1 uncharacterized protein LOC110453938 isoform X2 [Mizuhopecten yessoensis]XP_021358862.1 uncharacterized protein LOC110453938 isoform X2 [Mizuhopecten yessoensis]
MYGFLRGTKPSGLNLWVTFLTEDKFVPNDTSDEKQCSLPDIGQDGQSEDKEIEEEEYYYPYIRLYADCEDLGYGDGMPKAWRQYCKPSSKIPG